MRFEIPKKYTGFLFAIPLFLAACAHDRIVEGKALNAEQLTKVVRETAQTRNLPLRRELPIELVEKSFVREQFQTAATEFVSARALDAYQALLKKLKLIPADFEAQTFATDTVSKRVVGYYDSRRDVMRLVRRENPFGPVVAFAASLFGRDLAGEFLLAHELAHALADQNFDLAAYFMAVTANADALLARQAFVEGDAQLVAFAYLAGSPLRRVAFSPAERLLLRNPLDDWYQIPAVFRRAGLFLYLDGFRFAHRVYKHGGTQALNRAYVRAPRSTEEMLHPEKYFAGDDAPVRVTFAADPPELAGYQLIDENTLGEMGIQALLITALGLCGAQTAADGWGGDRFRLYQLSGTHDAVGFAWRSVWDSPAEREEFVANLSLALSQTYGVKAEATAEKSTWSTAAGRFTLRGEGTQGALLTLAGQ